METGEHITGQTKYAATICICTYNRADLLARCLRALREQRRLDESEVLVVNNASTDHTNTVCAQLSDRWNAFRVVSEDRPGLSHARNRGLEESQAGIIAYLDDDAVPEPSWLHEILQAFATTDADVVGGKVIPYWESGPKWWMSGRLWSYFADYDLGDGILESGDLSVCGGNMAFRSQALRSVGGFSRELGVSYNAQGVQYLGEETDVINRLRSEGRMIAYTGRAAVKHLVSKKRNSWHGLRARCVELGRTSAFLSQSEDYLEECHNALADDMLDIASCLLMLRPRDAVASYFSRVKHISSVRHLHELGFGLNRQSHLHALVVTKLLHKIRSILGTDA